MLPTAANSLDLFGTTSCPSSLSLHPSTPVIQVAIWDVDMGMELVSLTAAIESTPLSCAFSPDGTKLAVTESNGNVMIWSAMVGVNDRKGRP